MKFVLLACLVLAACSAPTAPTRADDLVSHQTITAPKTTLITTTAPTQPRPEPPPTFFTPTPAWQQAALTDVVARLATFALTTLREIPSATVIFWIDEHGGDGAHITGELRDPHQPRSDQLIPAPYKLPPGILHFPDKATFLHALETAVTYKAEVRLVGGSITCCLSKPVIAVTGRFEGDF